MSVVPRFTSLPSAQLETELDELLAQACANSLKKLADFEEIKKGKALYESLGLSRYEWRNSSTLLTAKADKIEDSVLKMARGKQWTPEFTNKVKEFCTLSIKDDEMKVKFCTDSASGIELGIIISCQDENDNHYIKVLHVDHVFALAPEVRVEILEDREPIYVKLSGGFSIGPFSCERESIKHVGDKVKQRIEKVVVPPKVTGGQFEAMTKYLEWKLCQIVTRPYMHQLDVDPSTRQMLEWSG